MFLLAHILTTKGIIYGANNPSIYFIASDVSAVDQGFGEEEYDGVLPGLVVGFPGHR